MSFAAPALPARRSLLAAGLALLTLLPAAAAESGPLKILRATPSGENVPAARQIVLHFDRPVVPLGRTKADAAEFGISTSPEIACQWRWLDPATLGCELGAGDELRLATEYRITVKAGLTAEDGASLLEPFVHRFATRRPKIERARVLDWSGPVEPVARVSFNQQVEPASASRHIYFLAESAGRVAAAVAEVENRPDAFALRPETPLPPDSVVHLMVEPGLTSVEGPLTGVEQRPLVSFRTLGKPRLLGIRCWDLKGDRLMIAAGADKEPARRCAGESDVSLIFSSPIPLKQVSGHLTVHPALPMREGVDPWSECYATDYFYGASMKPEFRVDLPDTLEPFTTYRLKASAGSIRDIFGRPLEGPIEISFAMDHRRPRLGLNHQQSVLEEQVETHFPVEITNLDSLEVNYSRLTTAGLDRDLHRTINLPQIEDAVYRFPLKVREWLGGRSGVVSGQLTSTPATRGQARWFFSQVTPFHVALKLGHYDSLAWVTDLATGEPIAGARVTLVAGKLATLELEGEPRGEAVTDDQGRARLPGTAVLSPEGNLLHFWRGKDEDRLVLRVERAADLALLPLVWDYEVDAKTAGGGYLWNVTEQRMGHLRSWGATAQGIYRRGDRLEYKIYVRNEGAEHLEAAPAEGYTLTVTDAAGKLVHERKELTLDEYGALDGAFVIPRNAAVGWYEFSLETDFAKNITLSPLTVLVTDFTVAPFRVTTDLDGELFRDGDPVAVDTQAALHSGGPYVDAETRITARLRQSVFRTDDPLAQGFTFDTGEAAEETLYDGHGVLDGQGSMKTSFEIHPEKVIYGSLQVESAVRDDRGKSITDRTTARYAGRDRFVGLAQKDWVLQAGQPAEVRALVVDEKGAPAAGTPVHFVIERRVTHAARVKGAGNAYLTEYTHTFEPVASCETLSALEPASCRFTPDAAGLIRLTAKIEDTEGRPVQTVLERWCVGPGAVIWEEPPGHDLELLPEKSKLEAGETARVLVKNPFPGALALVTVERLGVLRSWTQTLEGSTPILEIPIEAGDAPGVYVSVLVTSPRVDRPPGDGGVDLGKPAFRMGYAQLNVTESSNRLQLTVEPARPVYKPGEEAEMQIHVAQGPGGSTPETELAVAVLDESVLDLLRGGASLFDPYEGFHRLGPLDVENFNLLKNLIGIQNFERKGANPGGGGGGGPRMRSNFRFVAYWNPSLRPDTQGNATIRFTLPDNLTGWRVLVMAADRESLFGLGQGSFKVNLPTEVRPALPNQLVEGDRVEARFTVINRLDHSRTLSASARAVSGVAKPAAAKQAIEAAPFKRYVLSLPVTAGPPGRLTLAARAEDGEDADAMTASLPILPKVALETAADFGSTTQSKIEQAVEFPEGIRTDIGGLSVSLSPTILGGLEGAFEYLREYPYECWEQKISKAVMAALHEELKDRLPRDSAWPGSEKLVSGTLEESASFQTPGGGMAYYVAEDRHASPFLSAYTALAFRWLADRGHEPPAGVESALQEYLSKMLREDAFPGFYSRSMSATTRAVALAALARAGKLKLEDLRRFQPHMPRMSLFGKAHFLDAALRVEGGEEISREVVDAVLATADERAGKIVFSDDGGGGSSRILSSNLRTQCALLGALAGIDEEDLAEAGMEEIPAKLARTITTSRNRSGHFGNTQENTYCTAALVAYASRYEKQSPKLRLRVRLDGESFGRTRLGGATAEAVTFHRALEPADAGRKATLTITRKGKGRLYYVARVRTSPKEPGKEAINAGIEVRKQVSVERDGHWVLLEDPVMIEQGELVRVDLYLSLPAARSFVVVDDPVPGGLEAVNRDLATASEVDAAKAGEPFPPGAIFLEGGDWLSPEESRWTFYHRELRHDAVRYYSEYVPAGNYLLSYVAQAIAPGRFTMLPTHAEQMYEPDIFGSAEAGVLVVTEEP